MDVRELFLAQHARAHTAEVGTTDFSNQDLILRDVTDEQMRLRVQAGFNSLAWLLWHMTRAEDIGVNVIIAQRPQVLDTDDWTARLNMARRDFGVGMTEQEVDAFNMHINVPALIAYRAAIGHHNSSNRSCDAGGILMSMGRARFCLAF